MKLEPTAKQLVALSKAFHAMDEEADDMTETEAISRAWGIISPMVLEEAAKVCERREGISHAFDGPLIALACARAIRAMKGTPCSK